MRLCVPSVYSVCQLVKIYQWRFVSSDLKFLPRNYTELHLWVDLSSRGETNTQSSKPTPLLIGWKRGHMNGRSLTNITKWSNYCSLPIRHQTGPNWTHKYNNYCTPAPFLAALNNHNHTLTGCLALVSSHMLPKVSSASSAFIYLNEAKHAIKNRWLTSSVGSEFHLALNWRGVCVVWGGDMSPW